MRTSGILLPIFSLPSKYGIGSFSNEAVRFIDFLVESGQTYWQILPLVPPGPCESPYQSVSSFAGNPYFIDLDQLITQRLLTQEEVDMYDWGERSDRVDYSLVKKNKDELLRKAFSRSKHYNDASYIDFCKKNDYWLKDYAYYMAFTNNEHSEYYKYEQYVFNMQWKLIKAYANFKGIKIIGDIPIYVAFDSSDVYYNKHLFDLKDGRMAAVAGCPPDDSSPVPQKWGNPLYNWEEHKKTNYEWWIKRIRRCFDLHDVVRIDHFRGFYDYYSIPLDDNGANGEWKLGPGMDLFNRIKEEFGDVEIIAEDLGFLNQGVFDLLRDTGYPGMKILLYAFNGGDDNPYLPENLGTNNCVIYTGTHDNDTVMGWYEKAPQYEKDKFRRYVGEGNPCWKMIELAMSTIADMCIIPMQDYLELGTEDRTNTPGTTQNNWEWRMKYIPTDLCDRIKELTKRYNR